LEKRLTLKAGEGQEVRIPIDVPPFASLSTAFPVLRHDLTVSPWSLGGKNNDGSMPTPEDG